ncbi:MAG: tRNA 2-thiouridine(34) synthase MnmA [Elusimicrobiota bacterium]
MKKRVAVAMSGGLDSSVAAGLLSGQGYDIIGINMILSDPPGRYDSAYCEKEGFDDAAKVAAKIGFPFHILNCRKEFDEKIIDYFCSEYLGGRTPNPCAICNKELKFGRLMREAMKLQADCVATGHYACVEYDKSIGRHLLKKGKDSKKDQSYFLFMLSQEQLSRTLFPLGEYTKQEVKKKAKEQGLKVYDKPSSQEICFIEKDYRDYLRTKLSGSKISSTADSFGAGYIKNMKGETAGEHSGIAFYTIGQRKGIGAHNKPAYVISINQEENSIVIGEEKDLYNDRLIAERVNWIDRGKLMGSVEVAVKIRYRHTEAEAVVIPVNDNDVEVQFKQPQRAITPGQAAVFYMGEKVAGGGWIKEVPGENRL